MGCHNDLNIDLAMKDVFAFNSHAEESTAHWMIRATDDMVINFALLLDYLRSLYRQYNPARDVVIHIHLIRHETPRNNDFRQKGQLLRPTRTVLLFTLR
jgi:uncharacterized ferritin-like protein (DUF455 family)